MQSRKIFLFTAAVIESTTGVVLEIAPTFVMWLLFGIQEPSPEALLVGRIAGIALLAIGTGCWISIGDSGSHSQYGLLWAMFIYNVGVCVVLAWAGSMTSMIGVVLWPVIALHALMSIWCVVNLRTFS
ncbi:MAG: hypothetical protein JMN27_00800 [gamma proteobacterium endosymbiont of Lamellibrachia anaximandri]|nr:hypothetical protein [gamma proteobacterium endosymbiont of Lamellibrachia anaximandri]MBL3532354.1 hypothetical protein [gamma proteobacterium endosymbiont of Lamellibrachia anaximandri]MBL3589647.1 hypothetical protein [gamma proteobacterium endosymbiont of Lamellibrachia anaximandri]MBL3598532.1 hypothetical protein [gamma proteobacterium endosymbiont of Lamellibrachia anaximandri]MBL3618204.1 hypothetical protein [gamma proteobacterium endosymbiont of Lamellibrachia anaximandri]